MIELFEHNQKAYDAVVSMLSETGKAAVIHPTGSGKSFIGFKLCEDNSNKTVCWLSPSDYIFTTQLENLAKVSSGYQPENIKFFTYAKLMNMNDFELADIRPDYIILDEFHRCGAQEWGRGVDSLLEFHEGVPILGLSATNIRYLDNQRDMAAELFDGNIASEMTLGEAIVRGILAAPKYIISFYSYKQELEAYRKRVSKTQNKAVKDKAERYLEALRRALEKADGLDDIFAKHMTKPAGKYIVFCANFDHMQEMIDKAGEWFAKVDPSPKIYSVYSADPTSSRSFLEFKNDCDQSHLRLLYCIDALNEGIHVDDISGVILVRPTVSPIIYKQQIGRALAANQSSTPVIFDVVNNFENLYSINAIKDEMKAAVNYYRFEGDSQEIVTDTFRIIDEVEDCKRLFDELNSTLSASWDIMYACAKRYYEEHGDLVPMRRYKTEEGYSLGSWLNTQRMIRRGTANGYLSEAQIAKLDAIGMRWETKNECSWNKYFAELLEYYDKHGNIDVPHRYKTDSGVALGSWLSKVRMMYNSGIQKTLLTAERISDLNALGMIWDKIDYIWESYYQSLLVYYKENGNVNIPKSYRTEDGTALGSWLRTIKMNYRTSGGTSLVQNQVERLEALGVDLSYEFALEKKWDEYYAGAKQYFEEHGDLCISSGYVTEDGLALGSWISRLRTANKQKNHGVLSEEKRKQLDNIGMVWEAFETLSWEHYYVTLLRYYEEYGNIRMLNKTVYGDIALGAWLASKRSQYKKGILPEREKAALDSLGMDWLTLKERQWEDAFSLAESFFKKYGHLSVPRSEERLNRWITAQRAKYRQNALSEEQYTRLSSIGMAWELDDSWEIHYEKAKEYYHINGNLDIPADYETEDGLKLGRWYRTRLGEYQNGLWNDEKSKQLEAIGIQKESVLKRNWTRNYTAAKHFFEQNGHLNIDRDYVTSDGIKLGIWICSQRDKYKQGTLSDEQISLLEALEIQWNRFDAKWESFYELAVEYYTEYGDLMIPSDYETDHGVRLGAWLGTQRAKYKGNKLSQNQIELLDKIGMVWDPYDQAWKEGYKHALEYFSRHGNLNMRSNYVCEDGFKLFAWIQNKRTAYTKGRLSKERMELLEQLGIRWHKEDKKDKRFPKGHNISGNHSNV